LENLVKNTGFSFGKYSASLVEIGHTACAELVFQIFPVNCADSVCTIVATVSRQTSTRVHDAECTELPGKCTALSGKCTELLPIAQTESGEFTDVVGKG